MLAEDARKFYGRFLLAIRTTRRVTRRINKDREKSPREGAGKGVEGKGEVDVTFFDSRVTIRR